MVEFSGEFFEDEVRDGFFISSFTKRWLAEQFYLLMEIDEVCKKHGLKWIADWGTLLGAIRHKGFIPWDDDIDIAMPRKDYEKLRAIFKDEFPKEYVLSDYNNRLMEFHMTIDNGLTIHTHEELEKHNYYPFAAGIDIFPLDYLPEEEDKRKKLADTIDKVYKAIYYIDRRNKKQKQEISEKEFNNLLDWIEIHYEVSLNRNAPMLKTIYGLIDGEYAKYLSGYDEEGKPLSTLCDIEWWKGEGEYCWFNAESYNDIIQVPFEEGTINVPRGYDSVLRREYGEYEKHVRRTSGHGYPVFDQALKLWEKTFNKSFFRYMFDPEDLENPERVNNESAIQRYRDLIEMLPVFHSAIYNALRGGKPEEAAELLADCQDAVVNIGNELEKTDKYRSIVVGLEKYCEDLYSVYEILESDINEAAQRIMLTDREQISKLRSELEKAGEKEKIVFIVRRRQEWDKICNIWNEFKNYERYMTYLIPIPYGYIDTAGNIIEEKYEGEAFKDVSDIIDYRDFDIKAVVPDMVFTQTPYDGYNYAYVIPADYYTRNMKKYTRKLVYAVPFVTDEFDEADERSFKAMDYYVTVSGVVNSDHTIVQSENIRKHYIRKLTESYGDDTGEIWENRIITKGELLNGLS